MANVSRIEVTNELNVPVKDIKDRSQIDKIIRFIDERRGRWCSPRFGSMPQSKATLNFYREKGGKAGIRFGDRVFVVELADGPYKMDTTNEEEKEFLQLLGISQEDLFSN